MSNYYPMLGFWLWLAAVPLLMWPEFGGPALSYGAGVVSFLVGALLCVQWMMAGGMPRP